MTVPQKRFQHSRTTEEQLMDELMDGPASAQDLALETGFSVETTRRIIKNLQASGLVETWGMVANGNARPIMQYQLARTRKAA